MTNATNKSALAEFVCVYLTQTAPELLKEHQSITLVGGFEDGQLVKVVQRKEVQEKPELFSTHEKADKQNLLHAINLAESPLRIIVRCDDTDVLVLLIYYCGKGVFGDCKVQCQHHNRSNWGRCFALLTSITCYKWMQYNILTLQTR